MSTLKTLKMVRIFWVLTCFVVASTGCTKSPSSGGEISIVNGDFESGLLIPWDPFQNVQATVATAPIHGGRYSASETGHGSLYQDIQGLEPGTAYVVSGWFSGSTGATAGAMIGVYDPSGNIAVFSPTVAPKTDWQKLDYEFTVSRQTARIHLFRAEGSGTLFWDDVTIEPKK